MVKNLPAVQEIQVQSLGREGSPGEGNGNPLQYSCLESSMERGAWQATVHGILKELDMTEQLTLSLSHIKRVFFITICCKMLLQHKWKLRLRKKW